MTDDRDHLLDEIGAALSVEPTPAFAARVRSRIEREPIVPLWRPYLLMVAAAAVVLAVVGTVLLRPVAPVSPPTTALLPASQPPGWIPMPQVSDTARRRPALVAAPARKAVPTRAGREPDVIIPPDEAEALWRLLASAHVRRVVDAPPTRPGINRETGELPPLPEIAEIDVPALRIDPLPGSNDAQETRGVDD